MTESRAWITIKRGREGKRGASRIRHEVQPPHLRVIWSDDASGELLPALAYAGGIGLDDYFWVQQPSRPLADPVRVFPSADSAEPDHIITPGSGKYSATMVETFTGEVTLSAIPEKSRLRSSWTINTPERSAIFTITERRRDAVWRRTIGPCTKLFDSEWSGIVGFIALLTTPVALLKPPVQMRITDRSGAPVGLLTFGASAVRPREDFCLYLDHMPFPLRDQTLALAALAIAQRMR